MFYAADKASPSRGAETSEGLRPSQAQERRHSSHKKAAREFVKWMTRIFRCASTDVEQGSGSSDTQEPVLGGQN